MGDVGYIWTSDTHLMHRIGPGVAVALEVVHLARISRISRRGPNSCVSVLCQVGIIGMQTTLYAREKPTRAAENHPVTKVELVCRCRIEMARRVHVCSGNMCKSTST